LADSIDPATGVTQRDLELLVLVAGLRVPPEDLKPLLAAFKSHLEMVKRLDAIDVSDVDPAVRFDPRWRAPS